MAQLIIDATSQLPILQDNVEELRAKLGDLTPLMDSIGKILEDSTIDRFATKKAPDGISWANLMPSTQTKKGNNNILVQSGDLASSMTYYADKYSITIGTPESYGVYHQLGTANMPARPFLGLSDDNKADIYELINAYLMSN